MEQGAAPVEAQGTFGVPALGAPVLGLDPAQVVIALGAARLGEGHGSTVRARDGPGSYVGYSHSIVAGGLLEMS